MNNEYSSTKVRPSDLSCGLTIQLFGVQKLNLTKFCLGFFNLDLKKFS